MGARLGLTVLCALSKLSPVIASLIALSGQAASASVVMQTHSTRQCKPGRFQAGAHDMAGDATILVIGTFDTKSDELAYLREQIESQGASAICMDVSVLGDAAMPVEIDKHDVASAAGSSIAEAVAAGDENSAMQIMARGASSSSSQLHAQGRICLLYTSPSPRDS